MIAPPVSRAEYVRRIRNQHLAPLWDVLGGLVTAEPKTVIAPYRWRYRDVRPTLLESAGMITAKEAERRVLVFENPNLPGESKITNSLFGGFQLIMPGEVAPPHRHIQAALRFIIEGDGAYTAGRRRAHVHEARRLRHHAVVDVSRSRQRDEASRWSGSTASTCTWCKLFEASFREGWINEDPIEPTKPEFDSIHRYGANLVPVDHKHTAKTSPIFSYPYDRTREALEAMTRAEDPSPWFGYKMRYINPLTGGDAIPTMSTFMQLLPKGFETQALSRDRQHGVRAGRGHRHDDGRRHDVRLGAARHHRRSELDEVHAQGERRRGDLLLLRSRTARTARILARREVTADTRPDGFRVHRRAAAAPRNRPPTDGHARAAGVHPAARSRSRAIPTNSTRSGSRPDCSACRFPKSTAVSAARPST